MIIDISGPLRQGILVENEDGKHWYYIKYERLAEFCYLCGKIDHTERECLECPIGREGNVHQYDDWMCHSQLS